MTKNPIGFQNTVSNKKNTSSCFWNMCFSRISPESLELQKSYMHLFTSLTSFRWNKNCSNLVTKSADFSKNAVLPEKKYAIGKNPPFWKKSKKFRNWSYIRTNFWLKKTSRSLFKSGYMCLTYFCKSNFFQLL